MIERHVGDLLSVTSGIIVHGCNAQGVMGSGVAKAIREKYPKAYDAYRLWHEMDFLKLGRCCPLFVTKELIVCNAITQDRYGTDGKQYVNYDALRTCFADVARYARAPETPICFKDIHFPLIGCGLGGGDWKVIEPIIQEELAGLHPHLWVLGSDSASGGQDGR